MSSTELQEQAETFHSRSIEVNMVSSPELQEQAQAPHSRSIDVNMVISTELQEQTGHGELNRAARTNRSYPFNIN